MACFAFDPISETTGVDWSCENGELSRAILATSSQKITSAVWIKTHRQRTTGSEIKQHTERSQTHQNSLYHKTNQTPELLLSLGASAARRKSNVKSTVTAPSQLMW